jgi:3-phosphoshikimate 1-carboxyvinyltransferase
MLEAMGADVERDGLRIAVRPSDLTAIDVRVPGDISSAAFWLVAGAVHPQAQVLVRGVSVNPTRTGVLEILRSMGARLTLENLRFEGGEEVADIQVESSDLHATEIAGSLVPRAIDELPVLAVAACFAQGTTVIRDAAELRTKETDRIRAMAQELCRMGGQVEEIPDGLIIRGPTSLRGADCRSHGDHRVAMAVAVAGLLAQGETTLADAEAAAVSYPGFWQQMTSLAGKAEQ